MPDPWQGPFSFTPQVAWQRECPECLRDKVRAQLNVMPYLLSKGRGSVETESKAIYFPIGINQSDLTFFALHGITMFHAQYA